MIKTKMEKGITLVALIITIVVLLILAVVAITTITGTDLLGKANNATGTYNESVGNEISTMGGYENFIDKYLNGGTTEDIPQSRVGTTVQYDSNNDGVKEDWIIITDTDDKVEIVSKNVMYDANGNGLTLGYGDTTVNVTEDFDGDGTVGDDGDKAIASYNNAITTINNFCKSIVTATDNGGVRSVGGTNINVPIYSSTKFNKWFKGNTYVVSPDKQDAEDWKKLTRLGIAGANNDYWIASRSVTERNGSVDFHVKCVNSDATYASRNLWILSGGTYHISGWLDQSTAGSVWGYNISYGVRPVVINPTGI